MNKVIRHVFPGGRGGLRSRGRARSLLGHRRAGDLRDAAHLRLPRAAGEARPAHRRSAAADHRQRQDLHVQDQEGHLLHARPGVQGREARARRRRLRLFAEAPDRPEDPLAVDVARRGQDRRPRRAGREGEEDAASSTTTRRSPGLEAVDRYTLRIRLKQPDYNLPYVLAHEPTSRRRARGGRGLRRRRRPRDVESGRHRPVQAREVDALVEDLPRGESRLPRLRLGLQGGHRSRRRAASSRR